MCYRLGAGGEKHRVAFLLPGLCMLWTVLANSPAGVFYSKYGARGLIKPDAPSVQRLFVVARKKKKKKEIRGENRRGGKGLRNPGEYTHVTLRVQH